jgi:hypothetical protein
VLHRLYECISRSNCKHFLWGQRFRFLQTFFCLSKGKSTVLEAIEFVLGSLSSQLRSRNVTNLINDTMDSASVTLYFSCSGDSEPDR